MTSKPFLLASTVLSLAMGVATSAFCQGSFNGVYSWGSGGDVQVFYSSALGPSVSSSMGWTPNTLYANQTKTATVTGDPWPSNIGPATAQQSVQIPPPSPFPHTPVLITQDHVVHNMDGGYGLFASASADFLCGVSGAGPRHFKIDWTAQYTNTLGASGKGMVSYDIYLEGVGSILSEWVLDIGSSTTSGSITGVLPMAGGVPQDPKLTVLSELYQGQHVAGAGHFTFTAAITISTCGTPASDTSYGVGKAGTSGVPVLAAGTPMKPGASGTLLLANGRPGSVAYLLIGLSSPNLPFLGGTLLAAPDLILPIPIALDGTFSFLEGPLPLDGNLCGVTLYHQAVIPDSAAAGMPYSLSNGLARTIGA